MNKKAWWQKISDNYPLALADCKGFFEMRFRTDWRTKMQDYQELLLYFQEKYINIDLRPSYRDMEPIRFGYKLYAIGIVIHRGPMFENREWAAFDALEFAFRCREQYLEKRQQRTDFSPKSSWHKGERKKKTDGPSWRERVKEHKNQNNSIE